VPRAREPKAQITAPGAPPRTLSENCDALSEYFVAEHARYKGGAIVPGLQSWPMSPPRRCDSLAHLTDRVRRGDLAAFEELFRTMHAPLCEIADSYVQSQ